MSKDNRRVVTRKLLDHMISVSWGSSNAWVIWIESPESLHYFATHPEYDGAQALATKIVLDLIAQKEQVP